MNVNRLVLVGVKENDDTEILIELWHLIDIVAAIAIF